MGKLTKKDVEVLENSGVLDEETTDGLKSRGLAINRGKSVKRFMLTNDGKWVSPTLYWRGGKDTTPSKEMQEFNTKFSELLTKFATDRK